MAHDFGDPKLIVVAEEAAEKLSEEFEEAMLAINSEADLFGMAYVPGSGYAHITIGRTVLWDSENDDTYDDADRPIVYEACIRRLAKIAETYSVFHQ